jgi:hypothetical protein
VFSSDGLMNTVFPRAGVHGGGISRSREVVGNGQVLLSMGVEIAGELLIMLQLSRGAKLSVPKRRCYRGVVAGPIQDTDQSRSNCHYTKVNSEHAHPA